MGGHLGWLLVLASVSGSVTGTHGRVPLWYVNSVSLWGDPVVRLNRSCGVLFGVSGETSTQGSIAALLVYAPLAVSGVFSFPTPSSVPSASLMKVFSRGDIVHVFWICISWAGRSFGCLVWSCPEAPKVLGSIGTLVIGKVGRRSMASVLWNHIHYSPAPKKLSSRTASIHTDFQHWDWIRSM